MMSEKAFKSLTEFNGISGNQRQICMSHTSEPLLVKNSNDFWVPVEHPVLGDDFEGYLKSNVENLKDDDQIKTALHRYVAKKLLQEFSERLELYQKINKSFVNNTIFQLEQQGMIKHLPEFFLEVANYANSESLKNVEELSDINMEFSGLQLAFSQHTLRSDESKKYTKEILKMVEGLQSDDVKSKTLNQGKLENVNHNVDMFLSQAKLLNFEGVPSPTFDHIIKGFVPKKASDIESLFAAML